MKLYWNFLGGGGWKTKSLPWEENGYFLELHNKFIYVSCQAQPMFILATCKSM